MRPAADSTIWLPLASRGCAFADVVAALETDVDDALCVALVLLLVPLIVLVENPVREPVIVVLSFDDPDADEVVEPVTDEIPLVTAAAALEALLAARVAAEVPVKVDCCTSPD